MYLQVDLNRLAKFWVFVGLVLVFEPDQKLASLVGLQSQQVNVCGKRVQPRELKRGVFIYVFGTERLLGYVTDMNQVGSRASELVSEGL